MKTLLRATTLVALVGLGWVGGACRQAEQAVPALEEPPQTAAQQAERRADRERWDASVAFEKAAQAMTPQQVADADVAWSRNPEDLDTLKKLLIYYDAERSGRVVENPDQEMAARRRLVLWLIEHRPESVLTWHGDPRVSRIDPVADPASYQQASTLWLAHTSRPDASATVLDHAATFFAPHEAARAEALLTRARTVDSNAKTLFAGGEPLHWTERLADLYCQVLAGPNDRLSQAVRQKLGASQDAELLAAVGWRLSRCHPPGAPADAAIVALAKAYFELARQLDPQSGRARGGLVWLTLRDRDLRLHERLANVALEHEYAAVSGWSERERFEHLHWLANRHYESAEAAQDGTRATAHYDVSKKYAQDALSLARKFPHDPNYGAVVYQASVALGLHALRDGHRDEAVRYMLEAAAAPRSEELAWSGSPLQWRLSHRLLEAGERESVATFYERSAALQPLGRRERLLEDAAAVRAGVRPAGYKATVAAK